MNPSKSLNSNSLQAVNEIQDQLNELLNPIGCQVIPFELIERQPESNLTVKDPDGITHEFKSSYDLNSFLIHDCEDVAQACRNTISEYEDRPNSDQEELRAMREIAEQEAIELGYEVKKS